MARKERGRRKKAEQKKKGTPPHGPQPSQAKDSDPNSTPRSKPRGSPPVVHCPKDEITPRSDIGSMGSSTKERKLRQLTMGRVLAALAALAAILGLFFGSDLWADLRYLLCDIVPVQIVFENLSGKPVEVQNQGEFSVYKKVGEGKQEQRESGMCYLCNSAGEPIDQNNICIDPNEKLVLWVKPHKNFNCFKLYCDGNNWLELTLYAGGEPLRKSRISFNKRVLKKEKFPHYYHDFNERWRSPDIGIGFSTMGSEDGLGYLCNDTNDVLESFKTVRNSGRRFFMDCACQTIEEWFELRKKSDKLPSVFVEVVVGCYKSTEPEGRELRVKLRHARYPDPEKEKELPPEQLAGDHGIVDTILDLIRYEILRDYPLRGIITTDVSPEETTVIDFNVGTHAGVQEGDKFLVVSCFQVSKCFGRVEVVSAYEKDSTAKITQRKEGMDKGCGVVWLDIGENVDETEAR